MNEITQSVTVYQTIRERIIALDADIDETTLTDTLEGVDRPSRDCRRGGASGTRRRGNGGRPERARQVIAGAPATVERTRDQPTAHRARRHDRGGSQKDRSAGLHRPVRPASPALVVVDEGAIPAAYWVPREPRLDRLGVLNDLKSGVRIEGAELSNPEPVLAVRIK